MSTTNTHNTQSKNIHTPLESQPEQLQQLALLESSSSLYTEAQEHQHNKLSNWNISLWISKLWITRTEDTHQRPKHIPHIHNQRYYDSGAQYTDSTKLPILNNWLTNHDTGSPNSIKSSCGPLQLQLDQLGISILKPIKPHQLSATYRINQLNQSNYNTKTHIDFTYVDINDNISTTIQ